MRASIRCIPRTTLDIDGTVLEELKRRSRRERKTAGQLASELLAQALDESKQPPPEPFRWISKDLGPFKVDIEDKDALYDLLDEDIIRDLRGE